MDKLSLNLLCILSRRFDLLEILLAFDPDSNQLRLTIDLVRRAHDGVRRSFFREHRMRLKADDWSLPIRHLKNLLLDQVTIPAGDGV